jgi:hypothetical protein
VNVKTLLAALAIALLVIHPALVLPLVAVELAFLGLTSAAIARRLGITFRNPWRLP